MNGYELVIVCYYSAEQITRLLADLPETTPLVVVDNASGADGLPDLIAERPNARYIDGGGRGYAHAANLGGLSSAYDVVIFIDPDARPTAAMLDALAEDVLRDERCASSSTISTAPDGSPGIVAGWEPAVGRALVHAVGGHKRVPNAGLYTSPRPGEHVSIDWVGGPCTAVRRSLLESLGGFDERFFVYSEDVAFGRTVRERGLYQKLRTDLVVPHYGTGSGGESPEMLRIRGASLAHYLRAYDQPTQARMIVMALAVGYLARAAQQRLGGNRLRSTEHMAYVRGLVTGRAYVDGVEVAEAAAGRRVPRLMRKVPQKQEGRRGLAPD